MILHGKKIERTCWLCCGRSFVETSMGYTTQCPECGGTKKEKILILYCHKCKKWVQYCVDVKNQNCNCMICDSIMEEKYQTGEFK